MGKLRKQKQIEAVLMKYGTTEGARKRRANRGSTTPAPTTAGIAGTFMPGQTQEHYDKHLRSAEIQNKRGSGTPLRQAKNVITHLKSQGLDRDSAKTMAESARKTSVSSDNKDSQKTYRILSDMLHDHAHGF